MKHWKKPKVKKLMHHMYKLLHELKMNPTRKCHRSQNKDRDIRYPKYFTWGWGRDESWPKALIIHFMDMEKKRSTPSKRMGIYLHEDLTSSSSTCKENMAQVLDARKEGKRVGYRDGNIMMIQKSHMTMYGLWEFTHDYMELQFRSLRISAKYFGDTYK